MGQNIVGGKWSRSTKRSRGRREWCISCSSVAIEHLPLLPAALCKSVLQLCATVSITQGDILAQALCNAQKLLRDARTRKSSNQMIILACCYFNPAAFSLSLSLSPSVIYLNFTESAADIANVLLGQGHISVVRTLGGTSPSVAVWSLLAIPLHLLVFTSATASFVFIEQKWRVVFGWCRILVIEKDRSRVLCNNNVSRELQSIFRERNSSYPCHLFL